MTLTLVENRGFIPLPANSADIAGWTPINAAQNTFIQCRAQLALFGGQSGGGKLLCMDTPIPTAAGWKTMRDLIVGDVLFDDTGAQCRVTAVHETVIGDAHRIIFDDGSEVVADAAHPWHTMTGRERDRAARMTPEWRAKRKAKRPSRAIADAKKPWVQKSITAVNQARDYSYKDVPTGGVRTTAEIRDTLVGVRGERNHSIAVAGPLQYGEKSLAVHPYVFGCWLGDGNSDGGGYTCDDPEIVDRMRRCKVPEISIPFGLCQCGCQRKTSLCRSNDVTRGYVKGQPTPFIAGHGGRSSKNCGATYAVKKNECHPLRYQISGISHTLLFLGVLNNKHIPRQYLEAPIEQRLELLKGLMDTDGTAGEDGNCVFTSTLEALSRDVFELVLSLGIKGTFRAGEAKLNGRVTGPKFEIAFTTAQPVFHLKRKAARQKRKVRPTVTRRYVVAVEKTVDRPMRCISVDSPSSLYLCGRAMIPTHNTNVLVADSAQEFDNPHFRGILLRKSYTEMTNIIDEMEKVYLPLGARHSDGKKLWRFPAGGQMRLGYMAKDVDVELYTGKPISWLGIDEAQFQTEDRVRELFPWVSTPTEYGLRDRIRLSANPSAPWLMSLFLNNACPVCHGGKSVKPCAVYQGARWKRDDGPVMLTTCFIPAKLSENPKYDERKRGMLLSQTAAVRKKLLEGCWCQTEGAFFDFLNDSYLLPYYEAHEEWWHTHFVVMDYGMSGSAAATGLYFMDEASRIFKVGEDVERKMLSEDYAQHVAHKFLEREIRGSRCRMSGGYCDPAMDAHTGTGKSNKELINGVFENYGLTLLNAAKDSIGNAQALAGRLSRREFIYTDACLRSFESAQSRRHDPDRPGAILKVHGDDLDDLIDTDLYTNTFMIGDRKPDEILREEKLKELQKKGVDQRSLSVISWRLEHKDQKNKAAVGFGRPSFGRIQPRR